MSISISTEDVAPGEREAFWVATLAQLFGGAFAGIVCVRAKKEAFPAITRRKRAHQTSEEPAMAPQTARLGGTLP